MGNLAFAVVLAASLTLLRIPDGQTGDFISEPHDTGAPFRTAVASWNVRTPGGSWIEAQLRAWVGDRWTSWYAMGNWSAQRSDGHRHSIKAPADADGSVDTDTLRLVLPATRWQVRVYRHAGTGGEMPELSLVSVTTDSQNTTPGVQAATSAGSGTPRDASAWGIDIAVPERTQHVDEDPHQLGGGGEAWCSPTSVSMVMAYWAARTDHPQWDVDVPSAAAGTYDPVYDGCGNWPFNVAFASEHGLAGWVQRLGGLDEMDPYIKAGVPLIASIRVRPGELDGSPYKQSDGHLLVVRGFTAAGDVIANDPAGRPGHIRIVYKRDQFRHVWMGGSNGIVYVIGPPKLIAALNGR